MAENNDKGGAKGFVGVSSMVSEVDDDVKESVRTAERATAQRAPSPPAPSGNQAEPERPSSALSAEMAARKRMVHGIVLIALIAGFGALAVWGSKLETPAPPPTTNEQPPSQAPEPSAPAVVEAAVPPAPDAGTPTGSVEEQPPVGRNMVLTANQIRYCLSEGIRIGAARSHVNTYNGSDVDRFNAMVADYNSRCSSFRYQSSDLERVRSEVEVDRTRLTQEGAARFPDVQEPPVQPPPAEQPQYSNPPALAPQYAPPGRAGGENTDATAGTTPQLSQDDRSSIEAVCSPAKYLSGQEAYKECVQKHLDSLDGAPNPDVSGLSTDDNSSIQAVCSADKFTRGPAAYRRCVQNQLNSLAAGPAAPDLTGLSSDEMSSMQAVCSADKFTRGPLAYRRCLWQQVSALKGAPRPDTSFMSYPEKRQAEIACSTDKFTRGPAAYDACMANQIAALGH